MEAIIENNGKKAELLETKENLLAQIKEKYDSEDAVTVSNGLQELIDHQDNETGKSFYNFYPLNDRDVYDSVISSIPEECLISGHFFEPYPMCISTGQHCGKDDIMNYVMLDDNTIAKLTLRESINFDDSRAYQFGVMTIKVASPITLYAQKAPRRSKDKYNVLISLKGFFPEELSTNEDYTCFNGLPLAQTIGTVDLSKLQEKVDKDYGLVEVGKKREKAREI